MNPCRSKYGERVSLVIQDRFNERELYKTVNECIDTVHGWLGHGRGRIDLCEVYMK